jgi:hypothetical protein
MNNDVNIFKKLMIYDQIKKNDMIKENTNTIEINTTNLNNKINNDIQSTITGFNEHTDGINNLVDYIYANDICNLDSSKVKNGDVEYTLDDIPDDKKLINNKCCNNSLVSDDIKSNNFSCSMYSNDASDITDTFVNNNYDNYEKKNKIIEKFEDLEPVDNEQNLEEPEIPLVLPLSNTEFEISEDDSKLFEKKLLLNSDFSDKLNNSAQKYDGLNIPGYLLAGNKDSVVKLDSKKNYIVSSDINKYSSKRNDMCGSGKDRLCSHFPYSNGQTYVRPGKKNSNINIGGRSKWDKTNRINLISNNLNHISSNRNDMCGLGKGRMCSHFPYSNNHTYIRPGKKNSNIYVDNANLLNIKNNRNNLIGNNLNHIVSKRNDMCGLGKGRMCSHFPYSNNHTYIRPGKKNNNIYIDNANLIKLNARKPIEVNGLKIINNKQLCIDNTCLTKSDLLKLKNLDVNRITNGLNNINILDDRVNNLDSLKNDVNTNMDNIQKNKSDYDLMNNKITNIFTRLNEIQVSINQLNSLRIKLNMLSNSYNNINYKISDNRTKINNLNQISELTNRVNTKLNQLENEFKTLKNSREVQKVINNTSVSSQQNNNTSPVTRDLPVTRESSQSESEQNATQQNPAETLLNLF